MEIEVHWPASHIFRALEGGKKIDLEAFSHVNGGVETAAVCAHVGAVGKSSVAKVVHNVVCLWHHVNLVPFSIGVEFNIIAWWSPLSTSLHPSSISLSSFSFPEYGRISMTTFDLLGKILSSFH